MPDPRDGVTEQLLADAGIAPGMAVLDAGCGRGDVSLLLAPLVGEGGRVVGVDRDAAALAAARRRAAEAGLSNVEFVEADLGALPADLQGFDAAVARRVLMYQPDQVAAVQALAATLRPGGILAFQEHDYTPSSGGASLPLHDRVGEWMWRTVEREGGSVHAGFALHAALSRAGLTGVRVRAVAPVQTPESRVPLTMIVRAMLPRITAHGVATAGEIDADTLDQRLADELAATGASYVGELIFLAWARRLG